MRLTNEELAAIRERAEKATPGDWAYYENDNVVVTLHPDYQYAMEIAEEIGTGFDAEFIAASRTDVPKLLDYIAELEAEVKWLREGLSSIAEDYHAYDSPAQLAGVADYYLNGGDYE
jgi:hypothetical protein